MSSKPGILRELHHRAAVSCYRISSCAFTEQFITHALTALAAAESPSSPSLIAGIL